MKQLLLCLFVMLFSCPAYCQHQLYLGGGIGTGYVQNREKTTNPSFECFVGVPYYNANSLLNIHNSLGAQAQLYALYGYKKVRVGLKFDYLYVQQLSYTFSYTPSAEAPSHQKYSRPNPGPQYLGSSLVFEVTAFQKRAFSISPGISAGYSHMLGWQMVNSYFNAGTSLLFGYHVKPLTFYLAPSYNLRFGRHNFRHEYNNYQTINQSILITLGVRGDALAAIKAKKKG